MTGGPDGARSRALSLHAAAHEDIGSSRPGAAAQRLREALSALADAGPAVDDVRVRILVSLAHCEGERSRVEEGLRLLDQALAIAPSDDVESLGRVNGQRGLILMRVGRLEEAAAHMDRCVDAFESVGGQSLSHALLNRGALHLRRGDTDAARADLLRARTVAADAGSRSIEGKALHNLAYLALAAGDLPRSLADFAAADLLLRPDPSLAAVLAVDRARALAAAGLLGEADDVLDAAGRTLAEHHLDQDLAEALLVRAQVALVDHRPAAARQHARGAHRLLRRRGNDLAGHLAALVALQADLASRPARPADAVEAERIAGALSKGGAVRESELARLVGARAALATGSPPPARLPGSGQGPIGSRLMRRLVEADRAALAGDQSRRRRELREGLADLHRYAARFGSLDLQTAVAVHGRDLADLGLADALRSGHPGEVLEWAERARAVGARLPALRPPRDPVAAARLQELRLARLRARAALLSGRPDAEMEARCVRLQRIVEARERATTAHETDDPAARAGAGLSDERTPARPMSLTALRDLLGGDCLLSLTDHRGRVVAVHVGPRGAVLADAGSLAEIEALVRRVRADLDVLAGSRLPADLAGVVRASLAVGLAGLDAVLRRACAPCAERAGCSRLVVVPCGALSTAPWGLLPSLRGRPVTVARSVATWARQSARLARTSPDTRRRVVLVAGPGVARGSAEVRDIAGLWPGAAVLDGDRATTGRLVALAEGADVLHAAAHGEHCVDNPLFSELRLADGPLFGHDLPRLRRVPRQVVLSACDLGVAEVRPGDGTLGMTRAWLHHGAASVVAGVARVGDRASYDVMVAHHRGLAAGRGPAEALAAALERAEGTEGVGAAFLCFGAGW